MSFCSPTRKFDYTCFSLEELRGMAEAWNETSKDKIDTSLSRKELHAKLQDKFKSVCKEDETCWVDNKKVMEHLSTKYPDLYESINYFALKPKGTIKKNGWLSTNNINFVMRQYEKVFPDFEFLSCSPSDYYSSPPMLKKKYSAIIFNLDNSRQPGSHWVTVFFDNIKKNVEYFDSTGSKPNKNILEFLSKLHTSVYYSTFSHQKGNSACGIYAMYYILERLQGKTKEDVNTIRITDAQMNNYRSRLFRPN